MIPINCFSNEKFTNHSNTNDLEAPGSSKYHSVLAMIFSYQIRFLNEKGIIVIKQKITFYLG